MAVGGDAPISVQSMVKVPVSDEQGALAQIRSAAAAGAAMMRVAVPDRSAVASLARVVQGSPVPLVADIHFRAELALAVLESGAAGVRINPLTLGSDADLARVGRASAEGQGAVRVGVNAARLEPAHQRSPERMVVTAVQALNRLRDCGVVNVKVSVKASDLGLTVRANRLLAEACDAPIHLGLTEAGPAPAGVVKSTAVLTLLLYEGIGDTVRISLTADPVAEVRAARSLLRCLGLLHEGVDLVACPGCGRSRQDVAWAAGSVQNAVDSVRTSLTVAVMGCEVNGPGEASRADMGIAGAKSGWVLFRKGTAVDRLEVREGPRRLIQEILKASGEGDEPVQKPGLNSKGDD